MSLVILRYPHEALKTVCAEVTVFDKELHDTLDEMLQLMESALGMGLAGNQVGILKRFFIIKDLKGKDWEFINPKILSSEGHQYLQEGCLSLPGKFTNLDRAEQITVEAQDRHGETFKVGMIGIEAVCFQHELDHLNAIFYTDKLSRQQRRAIFREMGIK